MPRAWFNDGWADWMEGRFGVRPTLTLFDNPVTLDNERGEARVDGRPVPPPWAFRPRLRLRPGPARLRAACSTGGAHPMLDTATPRNTAVSLARAIAEDDAFRAALADLIAFPTDASAPDAPLHAYLAHVAQGFGAMGFQTQGFTSDGHPFRSPPASRTPTVLQCWATPMAYTVPGMAGRWAEGRDPGP